VPRYRLTIAYDGTDFHGWQRQLMPAAAAVAHGHTLPPDAQGRVELRTVQAVLMSAVRDVIREPVRVQGASRTDSGVHARAQTGAFSTAPNRLGPPDDRMARAINSRLPEDVIVRTAVRVADDFDPIADCVIKGYRYSFFSSQHRPLWNRRFVQHVHEILDADAMHAAAQHMVGAHDFAAFAAAGHGRESTQRTIVLCTVTERPASDEDPGARLIQVDVAADGFLWNMVRIIAGTLFEVGRGRLAPEQVGEAIASGDRRRAGPTLPPAGLCLEWAHYLGDDPGVTGRARGVDPVVIESLQSATLERKRARTPASESDTQ
jgi:tRNA pseudouridine38-40 synthase